MLNTNYTFSAINERDSNRFGIEQLKPREKSRFLCFKTQKVNMPLRGNCFICNLTYVLVCDGYVRTRLAPFDISHAGAKRGQENKGDN